MTLADQSRPNSMSHTEASQRLIKLRDLINEHRYQLNVLDRSDISEAAADSLKHELVQLEGLYPDLVTPDSPSQRVAGKPLDKFSAVPHERPMLSLNDVFDRAELTAWAVRCEKALGHSIAEYFVEIKKDGLAGAVIYENGMLVQGLTRGDGRTGEDVSQNFRTIESVPLRLRRDLTVPEEVYQGKFEVRGEVLLFKEDFAQLNQSRDATGKPLFANPRNTAAGTMRQLDSALVAQRRLRFLAYLTATDIPGANTLADDQAAIKAVGFNVENHSRVLPNVNAVMEFVDEWAEKRKTLPFGTDGLVITINDKTDFNRLGVVGKAPRGAVAYKFAAEQTTTIVKNIMVSIGRTGAATPFAVLEPTLVAGSTVGLATLHNESEVHRKDIRIGDTVIIQKAGDVIPEVVASLPKLRTGVEKVFKMPKNCPVCNTLLVKTDKEAVWRCPNFYCPALERGRIIHFASKDAYDIEGLGEKVVDALLVGKLIEDAADLFKLTSEQAASLERFAQKSAENLVSAIQTRKLVPFDRYIYGLGIRHVGAQTAVDIADYFGSLEKFIHTEQAELVEIPGIGTVVAESVMEWLGEDRNRELLNKLDQMGVHPQVVKHIQGKLTGQTFVITGTLTAGSREQIEKRINALGGKVGTAVTKETTYLVVGDDPGKSKIDKATKSGTKQIEEAELAKMLD